MNIGKTLFAQLMDFLPWTAFTRLVIGIGATATSCCSRVLNNFG